MTKGRELDDKDLKDISGAGEDSDIRDQSETKPVPADPPPVDSGPPFNAPTTG